jgi:aryl-alcohol dehydrogenase-like predicted oxidoreductase
MTATLGLGLAALGRPAYITLGRASDLGPPTARTIDLMRDRTWALLDEAWASGVRYIDAARSYGYAERFLGEWLARDADRRSALTIGSKWGYRYVAEWRTDVEVHEVKDHALSALDEQWPLTLDALGGAPDLYLIHSVTPDSPALGDSGLLDRLRGIAERGVRVGLSTSGPRQGEVVDAALSLAATPFSAVQSTVNLLEPSASAALTRAHDAGWIVVAKEVFANGRLTSSGDVAALSAQSVTGLSPDFAALGWALAQPFIDVALTGAVTEAQLAANGAAQPLGADDLAALSALVERPEQYWATRSALPWA